MNRFSQKTTVNNHKLIYKTLKADPRLSKPILWKILDKLKMPRSHISKLKDLYEFTEYKVREHERDSSNFFHKEDYEKMSNNYCPFEYIAPSSTESCYRNEKKKPMKRD